MHTAVNVTTAAATVATAETEGTWVNLLCDEQGNGQINQNKLCTWRLSKECASII